MCSLKRIWSHLQKKPLMENFIFCAVKKILLKTYNDFNKENNKEDPKFEVTDKVRISKYKNIFA